MFPNFSAIFYAILTALGAVVPWIFNLQHFSAGGTTGEFFTLGFVNPVAGSLTSDLLIGSTAFTVWMVVEARRRGMKNWWIYLVATFTIAFAFSAPLFLWMRERHIAAHPQV
jgi:hypothetical protein